MNLRPVSHLLLLATALATATGVSAADAGERIKFSDPSKPGTLKLNLPWADVKVVGTDAAEVTIRSSLGQREEAEKPDADGFRRLDTESTYELHEKNNVVTIAPAGDDPSWFSPGAEFTVEVPRNTRLSLRTQLGGDIQVAAIDGEIEVNGMNGDITLDQVSGGVVVNTMNGEVRATFARPPAKAVSITSFNGEIDVHLPTETKANLRLRTQTGSIRTNFPDSVLVTKNERVARSVGVNVSGTVNGAQTVREQIEHARALAAEQAAAARDAVAGARAAAQSARDEARAAGRASPAVTTAATPATPESPATPAAPLEAPEPFEAQLPAAAFAGAFGGKSIVGTLNRGGTEISLSSMNGTITVRQVK